MKVGDLVKPDGKLAEELSQVNRNWAGPAIIVKGPYEGSRTRLDQLGAKAQPVADEIRRLLTSEAPGDWQEGLKPFLENVDNGIVPGAIFHW